jgi:PAP2 superfamily protein
MAEIRIREHRGLLREAVLVNAAILVYFGIRNRTEGAVETAFANGRRLMRLEDATALAWEESVQAATHATGLVTFANWVYIWGHWPVIVIAGVALFVLRRDSYRLLRNAMFVSGAIGFLVFAVFPVAPPRLLDLRLVDTVTEQSHAYRALQPPGLTNQYAAFPSLHVGWNVLVGIVLFGATNHLGVRVFAVLSPLAMALAVVATANHFVVDVAGGIAVVLVGLATAKFIERSRTTATLRASAEPSVYERSGRLGSAARHRPPSRQPTRPAPRVRSRRLPLRRG